MNIRPRRLRRNALIRDMVADVRLSAGMFIQPVFVTPGKNITKPVSSMPGVFNWSPDVLVSEVGRMADTGLRRFLLFGTGEAKDARGTAAAADDSAVVQAIEVLRKNYSNEILLITDVCLCAYTDHGHCGHVEHGEVLNDPTLEQLAAMSLAHARAGADMVAPSDMMDGRVEAIRKKLDEHDFQQTAIMSYAVKYASAFYGPFRDAAGSAPGTGDRKSYQMDFRRTEECITEALTDIAEGADIVMVKPALAYLDVIRAVKEHVAVPIACYNVSGEYAQVKLAAEAGLASEEQLVMENMHAFARAGADIIITYHAADIFRHNWI